MACIGLWLVTGLRVEFIENQTHYVEKELTFVRIIQFNSIQFSPIQFNPIQFNSIQFSSIQFNSIQVTGSIQFNLFQFNNIVIIPQV